MGCSNSKRADRAYGYYIDVASGSENGNPLDNTVHTFRKTLAWYRKDCHFNEIYDVVKAIGQGSMGEVSIVRKRVNSSIATIKKIKPESLNSLKRQNTTSTTSLTVGSSSRRCSSTSSISTTASLVGSNSPNQDNIDSPSLDNIEMTLLGSPFPYFSSSPEGSDRLYACKTVMTNNMTDAEMDEFINEIDIQREFDHPNIVQLFEVYRKDRKIWLIMEICTGGDLESRMSNMSEERVAVVMEQMMAGLSYMHSRNVCHSDLKMENIMYEDTSDDAAIKLIDFGLSQRISKNQSNNRACGTIYTVAPEVLMGHPYTVQNDIWSAGVLAFVLLSEEYPFLKNMKDLADEKKMANFVYARYTMSDTWKERKISSFAKDYIAKSLQRDPGSRWTTKEALDFIQTKWIPYLMKRHDNMYTSEENRSPPSSERAPVIPSTILENSTALKRKHLRVNSNLVAAMKQFGEYGRFKKMVLITLAHTMDKRSLGNLKELFLSIDSENTGTLHLRDLKLALQEYASKHDLTDDDIASMFVGLDSDQSGKVRYIEFLAAVAEIYGLVTMDNVADAFDRLDCDNSGFITKENLISVLGTDYCDDLILKMLKEGDLGKTGIIDYSAFVKLMQY
uniref:Calmodulin n=1 Tax=Corethron hystrix TaxID=216773 RepID=A0A7S1B6C0_9STRA|mmetsp:Transcript_14716/g.32500  ORF Transcript_14716/g.32500 Transcript_14716/m.32500 type:complete len:619 (+) Transcript_14716:102-1958(+)